MRIGIIGTGGVGKAFIDLISKRDDLELIFALNSKSGAGNKEGLLEQRLYRYLMEKKDLKDFEGIGFGSWKLEDVLEKYGIDLLVEATPTDKFSGEPALSWIRDAFERGIHVVTANKGPVLLKYRELKDIAEDRGLGFGIGATAGAALPTISAGENDLAGARITEIRGVLNGTTNYILSLMERENLDYEDALQLAMEEGIAETDPSQDVEGWDSAIKMTIIANALMGTDLKLDHAKVKGITRLRAQDIRSAAKEGRRYKLLGRLIGEEGNYGIRVHPEKLSQDDIFYGVEGKNKGIQYITDNLGEIAVLGGASDVKGAAAAIIRDIIHIKERNFRK